MSGMRPGSRLLQVLAVWLALALLPAAARLWAPLSAPSLSAGWWLAGAVLLAVALVDLARRRAALAVTRCWPESLPLGVATPVEMQIDNRGAAPVYLSLREDAPASVDVHGLAATLVLAPGASVRLHYRLLAHRRGDVDCGPVWLRVRSRWGLWEFTRRAGGTQRLKVYPNFAAISQFATLGIDTRLNAMGVHLQQRRGEGLDFHQLRGFREGDALRQIDWKATARYRRPISREYQEERDQDVIFLLDCGRRMRTRDGDLSHFDHALNAVLLTAYVALRHGDAVGLMSFAGSERWLPPRKGRSSINALLNRLYDLHSTTATTDFVDAAQKLLNRHRKRALIVLVSDIRDEDADDLRAACRLLSSRHLLVVASLREAVLDARALQPVRHFGEALDYTGTALYRAQRSERLQRLRAAGIGLVDCLPGQLHTELVTQYLALKRSGVI